MITVHEGEDENQIIKDMEAHGEIPPLENFPAGRIRVLCFGSFLRRMVNGIGNAIF